MVGTLAKWVHGEAPKKIKSIDFIFLIVGHSFILPDKVFGRIEKELGKKDTIVDPQEYVDNFSKYGYVKFLDKDVPVFYDFTSTVAANVKISDQVHL